MSIRVSDILTLAALAIAVVWAVHNHGAATAFAEQHERVLPAAQRAAVQDALVGTRFSLPVLTRMRAQVDQPEIGGSKPMLVWFLDPSECFACFAENGSWSELAQNGGFDLHLVLLGEVPPRLVGEINSLPNTSIWRSTPEEILPHIGALLPHTRVVVNSEGIIMGCYSDREFCCWVWHM